MCSKAFELEDHSIKRGFWGAWEEGVLRKGVVAGGAQRGCGI